VTDNANSALRATDEPAHHDTTGTRRRCTTRSSPAALPQRPLHPVHGLLVLLLETIELGTSHKARMMLRQVPARGQDRNSGANVSKLAQGLPDKHLVGVARVTGGAHDRELAW
jgi:hypothetical protein